MKTLSIILCLALFSSLGWSAQTSERESSSKFEGVKLTKTQLSPKIVKLEPLIKDSFVEERETKLKIAKKAGDEVEARRIEQELNEYYNKNKKTKVDSSKIRRWYPATDIEVIYNEENSDSREKWGDDIIVVGESDHQKAPSMAVRHENGDIFIAYEEYRYSSVRIYIKRSTNGGESWSLFAGFYSSSGEDLLYPCIAIGEGNENKLFISYYYASSEQIYVYSLDLDTGDYYFSCVQTTGENIRPRITVDTDSYYYVYITWVEEDWPSEDDLYYSRSTDYGITFSDGERIFGGVFQNVDIGWGYDNLYVAYQGDNSPGKIYLIENSPYGNPSTWPSYGVLISENQNIHLYPRIAVSDHNERACVVYTYCFSGDDHDIYYSYTQNGTSWDVNNSLETGTVWESFADIMYMKDSSSGDNFHIAYYDDEWIKYRYTDNPSDWSSATTISDYSTASDDDFVAVSANSDNKGMVSWAAWISGELDILFDAEYLVSNDDNEIKPDFAFLEQNRPNPFNPETTISFSIPKDNKVELSIYNMKGQRINELANEYFQSGYYTFLWNGKDESGKNLSAGVYLYKLLINGKITETKKLILIR